MYSKEALIEALDRGESFNYVFFWGHKPDENGGIGPSCMSQWFDVDFIVDDVVYQTAEHFMMAAKADLFNDKEMRKLIVAAKTPNEAKAMGRKIKGFDHDVWEEHRFDIVFRGNLEKFSQNPRLGHYLKSTVPSVLVEASPSDAIWGIALHRNDPLAGKPHSWNGINLLGFALMKVRDALIAK